MSRRLPHPGPVVAATARPPDGPAWLSPGPVARYDHRLMATIRVALAEDNVLLREGVSRLVSANEEFELVGTAPDLPQLLALVREKLPDVVITDIRMPPTGPTRASRRPPGCARTTRRWAWWC